MERSALTYWKNPGDELIPGMAPAFNGSANAGIIDIWEKGDQNIQKADYIKLRDISLTYNFSGNWTKKSYLKNLGLSFHVLNAWRWAANKNNLDTEVWNGNNGSISNTQITPTRGTLYPASYTIGLSANF